MQVLLAEKMETCGTALAVAAKYHAKEARRAAEIENDILSRPESASVFEHLDVCIERGGKTCSLHLK